MKATILLFLCSLLAAPFSRAQTNTTGTILEQEVIEAALYGKKAIVEQALKQGYDVNTADLEKRTALMFAAFNGQHEIAELLLKAGADVNAQDEIGTSALMFAASGPSPETVELLLKNGAKINMVDNNEHFSALMWAAAEGQTENVKLLLAKGADLTLEDVDGDTAESFATKAGHYAAARAIKEYTAGKSAPKQPNENQAE
ncbi:ankyrin repeat domain-containing protein [Pontiellaceae bacterium B12219]|nr:ankyrin repeat domain-containing protein [Pontiellaceae bacterium B12219]